MSIAPTCSCQNAWTGIFPLQQ